MSCTVEQLLAVARSQIGVTEVPFGSNRTPYGAWYGLDGQPWCAMFVSWCADQVGALDIIPKHAYTPSGAAWFRAAGLWSLSPAPGAVAYMQWPGMGRISHVGVVEAVRADGSPVTIEGNTDAAGGRTGGRVMRQNRHANIAGYGHPRYLDAPATPAPVPVGVPTPAPVQAGRVAEDGELGRQTVAALQQALNATGASPRLAVDGEFFMAGKFHPDLYPKTNRALQARLNHLLHGGVQIDGVMGPATRKAWQRVVGVGQDGEIGPASILATQRALNRGVF